MLSVFSLDCSKPCSVLYVRIQMERVNWRQYFKLNPQQLRGVRIRIGQDRGVVRFLGPLVHEGRPAKSDAELWVGIEWDDISRGKNNGTVGNHQYFTTRGGSKSGSLAKMDKIQFGESLFHAFLSKYFRKSQIGQAEEWYSLAQRAKGGLEESELREARQMMEKKKPLIEYDKDAYFETTKHNRRMVEFIGFDKIWQKIHDLEVIKQISLAHLRICDVGSPGFLSSIFSSLQVLSLQNNMLYSWHQVYLLGHQLKHLRELSLKLNYIEPPSSPLTPDSRILCCPSLAPTEISPVQIFKFLKVLILMNIRLTWQTLTFVLPAFPALEEIALCQNNMADYHCIDTQLYLSRFANLKILNLDKMNLQSLKGLSVFGELAGLQKLFLNSNSLQTFDALDSQFKELRVLMMDYNNISEPIAISHIARLKKLEAVSLKHNPVTVRLGTAYVRQRAVAELPRVRVVNGSDLQKYQRKDCEIYYMKKSFQDYFQLRGVKCYDYDVADFNLYKAEHHPNLDRLIEIYSNPYPSEDKSIVKLIQQEEKLIKAAKPTGMAVVEVTFQEITRPLKIPVTWKVSSTRNFFSRTYSVQANRFKILVQAHEGADWIEPEDHKEMHFYHLQDGSRIRLELV